MRTAKEIRQSFKDFMAQHGHHIVPSAPMVIKDDPTLMFTNAGMNQFKDIILGQRQPQWPRVADSQKCLRVSGKHNDLEEVGRDTYHHTMFEMLGNWSFGDYFKQEAIDQAWEFLTGVCGLDPKRLYATVFEGSESDGVGRDQEAADIWARHLPKDHIINGNKHDNFWEMGDTGPCGPCSEIHIDLRSDQERAKVEGRELVNKDNPQVIEIWNLVFMQYVRLANGSLEPLPAHVVDTGMGFERLCMSLQGKQSNYDTDVFRPLLDKIGQLAGVAYGKDHATDVAMRVIADHIRTIAFAITDGQLPSNAKAGYVIRRILRRAVRYGYTFLGLKEAFMYRLVDTLIDDMGEAYPELKAQRELIIKVTKEEEDAFLRTLDRGIQLLDQAMAKAHKDGKTEISGSEAFQLFDTYGFPLDLTELILQEHGMTLDHKGFDAEMAAQKARARNAAATDHGDWVMVAPGEQEFVGYDTYALPVKVLRYRQVKQKGKTYYELILDRTPFYGEMGGQVGDHGTLTATDGTVTEIYDAKRENGVIVHLTRTLPADIEDTFTAAIDLDSRQAIARNHTATHLLHEALREVLGKHVEQKGSYVSPTMLRFDFSHFAKLTPEELQKVERLANASVRKAIARDEHRHVPIAKAREMGAMALFGEKYGDDVRVIRYGSSCELCGGTHVDNTGNIGIIKIVGESSIAAGIRRIEAITGPAVEDMMYQAQQRLAEVASFFNNTPDVVGAVQRAIDENASLKASVEQAMKERIETQAKQLLDESKQVGSLRRVVYTGVSTPDMAKGLAQRIRELTQDKGEAVAFVGATVDTAGKPLLTLMLTPEAVALGHNAAQIARQAARHIKGGGGGQPTFAQAGGKDKDGIAAALTAMLDQLR